MVKDAIKFPTQLKPDFINELRAKVKEYFEVNKISKFGNANLVAKTVFMLSLYLGPYALMVSGLVSSVPILFLCGIIMGIGTAGIGMGVMHDANHGSYSKNRKVNKLVGYSLYLLGGFPTNWKYQHNTLHHGYTNIEGHDEDIDPIITLRLSPHKPLLKIHKYQQWYAWFFYSLMTISWATNKDFKKLINYKKSGADVNGSESFFSLYLKLIFSKILYYIVFLVIPILVIPVAWYWIALSFMAMHFVSGLILAVIFQSAHVVPTSEFPLPNEKNNTMENNWAIHQLLTTADFAPRNRLFSWLVGGLNYQIEHHLFPYISHVHYRNISFFVKDLAEKYQLPYHVQPSFVAAVKNHTHMLKSLGRR